MKTVIIVMVILICIMIGSIVTINCLYDNGDGTNKVTAIYSP